MEFTANQIAEYLQGEVEGNGEVRVCDLAKKEQEEEDGEK